MDLHITLGPRGEHAARIYRQLLDAMCDGRLVAGTRLPATRELAGQLSISRTTVALAYDRLIAEGYLEARVGHGFPLSFLGEDTPGRGESSGPRRISGRE